MTVSTRLFNSAFLAIFVLFSTVPGVLAHASATTYLPSNLNSWSTYGSPTVSSDKVTIEGSQREWSYVDISAKDIDSSYILIASYADKSDSRTSYSSTDRSRSGNPYLYAYYLDSNGKIQKYLSGTDTKSTTRSDSDYVVYGIFPTVSGTKTIRVFLKQTSVKNISNSGANVAFMKPVLIEANSQSDAADLLSDFAAQNLSLTYANASTSSGSSNSGSSSTTSSCAGTTGTNVFKIGFESSESRDSALKFGSSLAAWYYGTHDYPSTTSPYDKTTTSQSYAGASALGLTNASYGYVNGETATSPQLYDEALRYVATGKLEKNAKYAFSIRAKYLQGSSGQSSVSFYLSQETGSDGSGSIVNTKLVNAGDSWKCLEYEFTNRQSTSTVQDLVVFFGSLPKGSTLYIDEIQLIKK
ncbi:carbohydrate binding domain-containing protein [Candidatus Uhrbacteria bacterium]|nr:carbohydrate binding domain-containing protein [Candidatus Uhrbacteria bacterium]